ncbi:MAG: hypothetical protein MMC33_003797 [Icmadophila ericetorum]|nr:hypothetical protein [Icmadophila ericetorum]
MVPVIKKKTYTKCSDIDIDNNEMGRPGGLWRQQHWSKRVISDPGSLQAYSLEHSSSPTTKLEHLPKPWMISKDDGFFN